MKWNITFDPDFKIWFYQQEQGLQDETFAVLSVLGEFGPKLGRPRVDTLEGSAFQNMKELDHHLLIIIFKYILYCCVETGNVLLNINLFRCLS